MTFMFFFKQKTAYEISTRDWSSDVCSSDLGSRLARHVDVVLDHADLPAVTPLLTDWIAQNPATIFDLYLLCADLAPEPSALTAWRDALPYQPGYLDRVAVFLEQAPDAGSPAG